MDGPKRRDAVQHREALISAAVKCFSKSGFGVPLEEIALCAGVGRGTLYRNFKDRRSLVIAIFERQIEELEAAVDATTPLETAMQLIAKQGASGSALFARLVGDLKSDKQSMRALEAVGDRLVALLEPIVERAHLEKRLRADVTADDVSLAVRMIGGLFLQHLDAKERDRRVSAALSLIMKGLAPQ